MKKEIEFYVIGDQYKAYNYGGAATLEGAKRLATKNEEYWDNWQEFHKPAIYKAEDCEVQTGWFGTDHYPKWNAIPYMTWNEYFRKWEELR